MVPHFKRLSDFILAKKWYMRALFMPGPERSDAGLRMRRHRLFDSVQPDLSILQIPFKPPHEVHIRRTLDAHEPRKH